MPLHLRSSSDTTQLTPVYQGQPSDSKAPRRLSRWLRQAQDLARPQRSERNRERQLSPDYPQTRFRWPHHPQACYDALAR